MFKGKKAKAVFIKVSTECWTKKPQKTTKALQSIKVPADIMFN